MVRETVLALLLCTAHSAPALAQVRPVPLPGPELDSLLQAADSAGRDAARQRGVGHYFILSYLGGASAGFLGPIALTISEPTLVALSGAGVATFIATTAHAGRREIELPPQLLDRLRDQPPVYREAFRVAYSEHLSRRRVKASLWGGAVGAGVGLGSLVWLLYQLAD